MELTNLQSNELHERLPLGYGGRFYGVYPALVTDIKDPGGLGRVQVKLPWSPDTKSAEYLAWARIATLMAGNGRGSWFIPEVDDEVLISFEGGDPRKPYVLGGLWNGQDAPPEAMDEDGENNIRSITSRNGIQITLDDTADKERIELKTPLEQVILVQDDGDESKITIKDKHGNTILLNKDGMLYEDTNGTKITQSKTGIKMEDPTHDTVVELNNGKINLQDQQSDTATLGSGTVEVKNASGHSVKLDPQGVKTVAGPAKIAATTASGILAEFPPGKIVAGPSEIAAEYAASSVKIGPAGVQSMGGPSVVKVGPDGISLQTPTRVAISAPTIQLQGASIQLQGASIQLQGASIQMQGASTQLQGAMISMMAPLVSVTSAMAQFAGMIQSSGLIVPTVVSGSYTPGGGNIL